MQRFLIVTCLLWPVLSWSQSCEEQNIKLQVLGSGGPELTDGRVSSSHLIWLDDKASILIDAGSGSAHQFEVANGHSEDLKAILLTHLHVDHSVDVPAFIKDSYFTGRQTDLWVMGPQGNDLMPDTRVYLDQLFGQDGAYAYLKSYWLPEVRGQFKIKAKDASLAHHSIQQHVMLDGIKLSSIGVHHGPISAVAWRVDVGDCAITFSGDMTNKYDSLARLAQGSDVLVANNTIEEASTAAAKNMHMVPSEIGKIATKAGVKKLLLAHFMLRSLPHQQASIDLIKEVYQGPVLLAEDLMWVELK
ncbi:MBL fold metallo-hydrolase [Marinicella litoralis]|uniref:Ribonuclease BN (tRNA processing enzyme) n=1 Tax=Marinicella litoralis TaxID=644220 RepID=A0A4R6Y0M5_9GAMM|nr:MBL fold metallo-hydrolase [Marinicella litoralis]TDR23673.1 ribonuclease BN (tRNA processing enzyme) [Marinicella litoralis]